MSMTCGWSGVSSSARKISQGRPTRERRPPVADLGFSQALTSVGLGRRSGDLERMACRKMDRSERDEYRPPPLSSH